MANITTELGNIACSKYGSAMRSAIHDAIEKVNTESAATKSTVDGMDMDAAAAIIAALRDVDITELTTLVAIINSYIGSEFITHEYKYTSQSISANATGASEISPTSATATPASGYTPVAIVSYSTGAAGLVFRGVNAVNGKVTVVNTTSSAKTFNGSVKVLCRKDR